VLFFYISYCCPALVLISLLVWAFAGYAYHVNAKRPAGDPTKRDFSAPAIFLAPITWPLFLLAYISLFVIRALAYGVFLILFAMALLAFRKPFLLVWLEKVARKVGDKLMEANTFLLRLAFGNREKNTRPI